MTACVTLYPQQPLAPGRYRLDHEGRLHPIRFAFVRAVAIVSVRAKPGRSVEQIRADCAAEAAVHEERVRQAKRLTTAHPLPATVRPLEIDRSLARRKVTPAVPAPQDSDEAAMAEFSAALARVQQRRQSKAGAITKPATPKIDGQAIAAAHARKKAVPPPPKKPPTRRALGPGECHRCGIPGFRGCDHFLPYKGD